MYLIFEGVVCKVKKKFYKTVKVEKNDITYLDRCFFVDYYILETQKSTERHGYIKSFGIEAVKRYTDYFENNVIQEDRAYDITQSENEIYAFAEKSRKQPKVRRGISLFTLISPGCAPKNRG